MNNTDHDDDCAGCREAERLEALVNDAAALIRAGDVQAALDVLMDRGIDRPTKIARDYVEWQRGKLAGFVPPMGAAP